jgi:hypothetical protein
VPFHVLGVFSVILLSAGMAFHSLLEAKGARTMGLAVIFIGIVPLMIGAVASVSSDRLIPAASWLCGISPASAPVYASATLLSISELPVSLGRSVPRAFYFWLAVSLLGSLWLVARLRVARKSIANSGTQGDPSPPQPPDDHSQSLLRLGNAQQLGAAKINE